MPVSPKKPLEPPPRWPNKLLRRFCAPHLLEEVMGDLHERYYLRVQKVGKMQARKKYWREVMAYMRLSVVKGQSSHFAKPILTDMIKSYLVFSIRKIARNKAFSVINILGLSLGMTCFLLIFLWINDERSKDNFHSNGKNLYNIYQTSKSNGQVNGGYTTPVRFKNGRRYTLLEDLKEAVPEVEYLNFYATGYELPWGHPETFQVGEKIHKLEGSRAGEDFFSMFSYPVIAGNPLTALKDISSVAISRKMAEMFFESPEEAIGKSIRYENVADFVITAVFENVSVQSSLKFDYLINWEYHMGRSDGWASHAILTTIQIAESADAKNVENNINRFLQARLDKDDPVKIELGLQRFSDQYLISNFINGKPQGGRIEYVKIFGLVAIFVLIVACINFMNLATARSVKQAKEVGVRKVAGSSRGYLIAQFIGESVLTTFLSLVLSTVLLLLLLPGFNTLAGKQITLPINEPLYWLGLAGLMLATGFIAGSYPAFFLSSLRPAQILKGTMRFTNTAIWFRKGLVVFQFGISILLLIATIVVSWQTDFVQNTHLGYDRENLIYVRIEGELNNKYAAFKDQLTKMPGIAMVDRSSEAPHAMGFVVDNPINWEGKEENVSVGFKPVSVGFDFLKIMNLEIVDGRGFSREYATDTAAFMVNEIALKQMGIQDPIGKWVSAWDKKGHIIGILKDYHTHSLHEPIKPLIVDVKEDLYFGIIMIRTEAGKTKEALASLEKVCKDINPDYPLAYQFLDQEYEKLYRNEQAISQLSNAFAGLAVMISCLGLLGLAMFSAEQRIKEIGIRKVLGASVSSIVTLFSKDFLQLVSLSFVIAAPIAWFFVNKWLQGFAYQIDLAWWIFAATGLLTLFIALLTVSVQAIKAALSNPVNALRTE
ncbi:permease prefix domain 2-containing transporter [Fulvivirgaceae bacterium BMA12]|uniref:Permease prefix domain 2-containing transporter n=1 Tax=Agaribacillus aureus TaxID=3051825 RepID=A0ABT8LGF4_9BACT|nr:permease prefix domain 2-containing transporter [Fulvivirgaceae bacterium BMA12]